MQKFNISPWTIGAFILLTALIEAPLIAFPYYAGDAYRGINIAQYGDDEHHYLTRGKEVLEGHSLGQPYLAEWKDKPDSFQSDAEYALMTPFRVLGFGDANVVTLYGILNALGIFALLVLIYYFVLAMSGDMLLSAACALFVIGGSVLIQNGTVVMWILRGNDIISGTPNIYGRSTDPYTALVPFFGFLILTYRAIFSKFKRLSRACLKTFNRSKGACFFGVFAGVTTPRPSAAPVGADSDPEEACPRSAGFQTCSREQSAPYAYVLGAGVLFGVLFYDYFYAWTFSIAFLGALFLCSLAWKRWHAAIATAAIGVVGIVFAAPMLTAFVRLYTSLLGMQFSTFHMAIRTHAPIMSATGIATAVLFAIYFYYRRGDRNNFFICAIIAAGWLALEQQVLTGRVVQYGHYYWYFVVPLSIIVSIYMLTRLVEIRWHRWSTWLCYGLIAAALINTAGGQYTSFWPTVPIKMREQDFAPIVKKLQHEPYGVVLGDPGGETYPFLVTIYTNDDEYWTPAAITAAFPIDHLKEALFVYLYINKESRRDPVAYLRSALSSTTTTIYADMYESLEAFESGIPVQNYWKTPFPHSNPAILAARSTYLPRIGAEYGSMASSREKVISILRSRGVRYILWDKRQYPEWDLSALGPLMVLATSTDIILYSLSTTQ